MVAQCPGSSTRYGRTGRAAATAVATSPATRGVPVRVAAHQRPSAPSESCPVSDMAVAVCPADPRRWGLIRCRGCVAVRHAGRPCVARPVQRCGTERAGSPTPTGRWRRDRSGGCARRPHHRQDHRTEHREHEPPAATQSAHARSPFLHQTPTPSRSPLLIFNAHHTAAITSSQQPRTRPHDAHQHRHDNRPQLNCQSQNQGRCTYALTNDLGAPHD